jgi:hypothetical protein
MALAAQLPRDLQAVQARQVDVEDNDIGLELAGQFQRFVAVGPLSHDGDIRLTPEHVPQSLPEERMVIY